MVVGGGQERSGDEEALLETHAGAAPPVATDPRWQPRMGTLDDPLALGWNYLAWAEAVADRRGRAAVVYESIPGDALAGGAVPTAPDGGLSAVRAVVCAADPECAAFTAGFLYYGGALGIVGHAYLVVTECEGSQWAGYYGTPYWSRAQFSGDTWAKVIAATGLTDPDDPYSTGANMAAWIGMIGIEAAGTRSGWPTCWWVVQ